MHVSRVALVSAISAWLVVPVFAADIDRGYEPAQDPFPPAPATYTFAGFYLGLTGGFEHARFATNTPGTPKGDGFQGGGYAGYNFQFGQLVVGAEGDLTFSTIDASTGPIAIKRQFGGSVRGRIGATFDRLLVYGTGGLAATDVEVAVGPQAASDTHYGWVAGAGIEGFVTKRITARLEYLYSDYENKRYTLGGPPVQVNPDSHVIRAGIGFKF